MDEGTFRLLRALAPRAHVTFDALPLRAGEAESVVKAFVREREAWLERAPEGLRLSEKGLAALALELLARAPRETLTDEALMATLAPIAASRPPAKRELDQVYATLESSVRRARRLVEGGDAQRGLLLLGDDDLTSIAVCLLAPQRPVTVVEVDKELLAVLEGARASLGLELKLVEHDLRDPLPRALAGKAGAVHTDPPYAIEGFGLFVERALEALRPDGRLLVAFGKSRRAPERGAQKQRVLLDAGLCIEEIAPDFTRYEGAESIGGVSSLYVCARTGAASQPSRGRVEGDLYTSRKPREKGAR